MRQQEIDWDNEPLGKESDYALGKKLGVKPANVRYQRVKRGLESACPGTAKRGIDWDNQPLGRMADAAIAYKLDVTVSSVKGARQRRGIAPWNTPRYRPGTNNEYFEGSGDSERQPRMTRADMNRLLG